MSDVLSPNSAAFLDRCFTELEERTDELIFEPIDFSLYDVETGVMCVYYSSLELIKRGYRRALMPPSTGIARMTIRFAERRDRIGSIDQLDEADLIPKEGKEVYEGALDAVGCLEAEPRLAHSLAKQRNRQTERYPAFVLPDIKGRPLAYQKGNGGALAFAWRDGYIPTGDGPKWVPKHSIIRPIYEEGYDPRDRYAGEALVASPNPHIRTAHFLRFVTASWLPESLAYQAAQVASKRIDESPDVQAAATLSGRRLAASVQSILRQARVVRG